jgi:inward rectifier potassium channel
LRVANERTNYIAEAQLRVSLIRNERTAEGESVRRIHDLPLVRAQTPAFIMSWTAMHVITPQSPLFGATPESLAEKDAQVIVTLLGIDEVLMQTIHSRYAYVWNEILFGKRFRDVFATDPDGRRVIDYTRFHDVDDAPFAWPAT